MLATTPVDTRHLAQTQARYRPAGDAGVTIRAEPSANTTGYRIGNDPCSLVAAMSNSADEGCCSLVEEGAQLIG